MMNKRVLLLCGHYGSGKTNIAVNLAQAIKREHPTVTLADLDIVNPYFRSYEQTKMMEDAGITAAQIRTLLVENPANWLLGEQ